MREGGREGVIGGLEEGIYSARHPHLVMKPAASFFSLPLLLAACSIPSYSVFFYSTSPALTTITHTH